MFNSSKTRSKELKLQEEYRIADTEVKNKTPEEIKESG
jgi:hypothetical protein